MIAQTASFVVQTKLKLSTSVEHHLEKSFHIVASAYNEAISFGLRRFKALKQNPLYQELLENRRTSDDHKECDKALFELRKSYGLTEYGLSTHLGQQRRRLNSTYQKLNSGELQVIAAQAYKALEKVLFYKIKVHSLRFRSKYDLNVSYRNRVNTTGTRLVKSDKKELLIDYIFIICQLLWIFPSKPLIVINKRVSYIVRKSNMSKSFEKPFEENVFISYRLSVKDFQQLKSLVEMKPLELTLEFQPSLMRPILRLRS